MYFSYAARVDSSVEVEWSVTRKLGLRVEPMLGEDVRTQTPGTSLGVSGGVSWKLVQDFAHDFLNLAQRATFRIERNVRSVPNPYKAA